MSDICANRSATEPSDLNVTQRYLGRLLARASAPGPALHGAEWMELKEINDGEQSASSRNGARYGRRSDPGHEER